MPIQLIPSTCHLSFFRRHRVHPNCHLDGVQLHRLRGTLWWKHRWLHHRAMEGEHDRPDQRDPQTDDDTNNSGTGELIHCQVG